MATNGNNPWWYVGPSDEDWERTERILEEGPDWDMFRQEVSEDLSDPEFYMNAIPPAKRVSTGVQAVQWLRNRAKEGEVMGAEPMPGGASGRVGRQGRTYEGQSSRVQDGQPSLPPGGGVRSPAGGGRSGGPPPSPRAGNAAEDWLSALVRGGSRAAGSQRGGGQGRTRPRDEQMAEELMGAGSKVPGGRPPQGPPELMDVFAGLARSMGNANPLVARTLSALGINAAQMPGGPEASMDMQGLPPDSFVNQGVGQLGPDPMDILAMARGNAAVPEGDYDELPPIDYDALPEVDTEAERAALEETRPEEPRERGFLEDLGQWVVPALAGGILGGPLGIILGGLMGEGSRQTRNAEEQEAYEAAMNEFDRGMIEYDRARTEEERERIMEEMTGMRQNEIEDFQYQNAQREADLREVEVADNRQANLMQRLNAAFQMANTQQQMGMRQQAMQGGYASGVTDPSATFATLAQTNPQLFAAVADSDAYQNYRLALAQDDQIAAQAHMSHLLNALRNDPQVAPYIQQIEEQQRRQQMFEAFQ